MKTYFLFIFHIALAINVNAQSDHDCIGRDQFHILKVGSSLKSGLTTKTAEIKSSKIAEKQFGTNYKAKRQFAETQDAYYNNIVYDNGLELNIPENQRMNISFHINSDKYLLMLTNGQTIKVGMKSDDLKAIFPKSFSKRSIIDNIKGNIGKVALIVYFSRVLDGKVQIMDSCIVFILNGENGILEEFYSHEPS